jgi:hypothetical protein
MPKQNKPSPLQLAAHLYGCQVEDLLSHRVYPDGSVVIIAPTGQKFTYSAEALLAELARQNPAPPPRQAAGDEEPRSAEELCPPPTGQSSRFQLDSAEQVGTTTPETPADRAAQAEPALISEPSVRGAAKKPRKRSAGSAKRADEASTPQEDAEG